MFRSPRLSLFAAGALLLAGPGLTFNLAAIDRTTDAASGVLGDAAPGG